MLIGFMGTGKTTVSRKLSEQMKINEVDMDAYIVEEEGRSINEIFKNDGEEVFRQIETQCLKKIQSSVGKIVSCGGGAVIKDENVSLMKEKGKIVLLTAKPETVYKRVKNSKDRPILNGNMNIEFIAELMAKRDDRYHQVADIIIATDDKTPEEICNEIKVNLDKMV